MVDEILNMRAKRVDDNQAKIVEQLRRLGVTVQHLHTIGQGCPDLLLGVRGRNFLIELKDSEKTESQKRLTDDEKEFFNTWRGQVNKCETLEDILKVVGL
ncbi:MAG TPA: hypothetical protein VF008_09905 [Niastella sp.]